MALSAASVVVPKAPAQVAGAVSKPNPKAGTVKKVVESEPVYKPKWFP
ncbi:MAG: hypothetical protein JNM81_09620 [Rhodospirillaceae bacterium]|nr:hypothetical protein [Rhodospirillaceae bacterium]